MINKQQASRRLFAATIVLATVGCGGSDVAASEWCQAMELVQDAVDTPTNVADASALRSYVDNVDAATSTMVQAAPDDIAADAATVSDSFQEFTAEVRSALANGSDLPSGVGDESHVADAFDRLDGYYAEHCAVASQ